MDRVRIGAGVLGDDMESSKAMYRESLEVYLHDARRAWDKEWYMPSDSLLARVEQF